MDTTLSGSAVLNVVNFFDEVAQCVVTIEGDAAPVAVATVNSVRYPQETPTNTITVLQNEPVVFDGTGSTDDKEIVSYQWQIADEDALFAQELLYHTFTVPGEYSVVLTVADSNGSVAQATVVVTVLMAERIDSVAPTCSVIADGDALNGNASDISDLNEDLDDDGYFSGDEQDRNGNGMLDIDSGIASISLSGAVNLELLTDFEPDALTGSYSVYQVDSSEAALGTLVVTDGYGNSCTRLIAMEGTPVMEAQVLVAPVAVASVALNSDLDGDTQITVNRNTTLYFDSSDSTDADGEIISRSWTLVSENSVVSDDIAFSRLFSTPGEYELLLTVMDDSGLSSEASVTVTVLDSDSLPTAEMELLSIIEPDKSDAVGQSVFSVGSVLTVRGSAEDMDGDEITTYIWQLRDSANNVYREYRISTTLEEKGYRCELTDQHGNLSTIWLDSYEQISMLIDGEGYFEVVLIVIDSSGAQSEVTALSRTGRKYSASSYVETSGGAFGIYILALLGLIGMMRFKRRR